MCEIIDRAWDRVGHAVLAVRRGLGTGRQDRQASIAGCLSVSRDGRRCAVDDHRADDRHGACHREACRHVDDRLGAGP